MEDFWDNPAIFLFLIKHHPVLRDSALGHPKSAHSVQLRVHFFKVYYFVSCFPTVPLNRTKLKYGIMKLKAYKKIKWMIELGATYVLRPKCSLSVCPESGL